MESSQELSAYLADIGRHPLLTPEEEHALALRYRSTGDAAAAQKLVVSNLRFVVKVAREYRRYQLRLPDLIQEGNLGLLRAVEKFEPERGIRLISYASWWIRAFIQSYILRSWSLVKLGTTQTQRRLFFSLARARREIERLGGSMDADTKFAELATALGVDESEVREMEQRMSGRDLSLDAPVSEDGPAPLELVESRAQAADDVVADAQMAQRLSKEVAKALAQLDPRERLVMEQRAFGDRPLTFRELGENLRVSRERARQLELRAKHKLRRALGPVVDSLDLQVGSNREPGRVAA